MRSKILGKSFELQEKKCRSCLRKVEPFITRQNYQVGSSHHHLAVFQEPTMPGKFISSEPTITGVRVLLATSNWAI
ncbi:unnamed protein product [Arabidopsis lyrata]|nr:unnamed protein product [Arabidopsis lyrata]